MIENDRVSWLSLTFHLKLNDVEIITWFEDLFKFLDFCCCSCFQIVIIAMEVSLRKHAIVLIAFSFPKFTLFFSYFLSLSIFDEKPVHRK